MALQDITAVGILRAQMVSYQRGRDGAAALVKSCEQDVETSKKALVVAQENLASYDELLANLQAGIDQLTPAAA